MEIPFRLFFPKSLLTTALLLPAFLSQGQGLVNSGAKMSVATNTFLVINSGGFTNDGAAGQVTNAGTIEVDGAWTNNSTSNVFGATPTASTGGTVILDGAAQNIAGTNRTHFYNLTAGGSDRKTLTSVAAGSEAARIYNQVTLTTGVNLNSRTLTLENGANTAIQGAGVLVSESVPPNYGRLSWNIGNATTGNYTIPFANASGSSMPLDYNISDAGSVTGSVSPYKRFSTYPTAVNNTPWATTVTHVTDNGGTDNSNKVFDRFWIIENDIQGNYGPDSITDYPDITVSFGYLSSEVSGTIVEANMYAQRFNDIDDLWGDWLYSPTASGGSVTVNLTRIEDYFPIWTLVDESDPLPIELARFVGQCADDEGVMISWTTYTEIDNDFFTLERSKNGVDFETVDIIEGAGNSNSPITYQVSDKEFFGGTSYYRLKNTDFYGKEEYSQVIAVTCGDASTTFDFVNAYEIDNVDLMVEFTASQNEPFTVTLFDASGRVILDYGNKAFDGMNKVRLPVGNIAQGIYIINLQNNSQRFSRKVLLK